MTQPYYVDERACTGVAAQFCPIHGECVCPLRDDLADPEHERTLDDPACPLHSPFSQHAEAVSDRPPWAR